MLVQPAELAAKGDQLSAQLNDDPGVLHGAHGAAPGLACWHEAVTVQAVDTTAAGDTFLGALTVQLARGLGLNEATQWAMRAASICVTRAGAQPSIPYFAEVDTLTGATRWSPV